MQESEFQTIAKTTLEALADALEPAYESGALEDILQEDGVLTLVTATKRTLVISKHGPMQQIWLASPITGGLHFSYDAGQHDFRLGDGRTLHSVMNENLQHLGIGVRV